MSELSQQGRIGQLSTPAGADVFALSRFEGTEAMSVLFEYRIGAVSQKENFDLDTLIGKNCAVKIVAADGKERYFNGVLTEGNFTGGEQGLFSYQFVLRPWLHLLSRTSDCRIFAKKTPADIIKQVFTDRGFNDFTDKLNGNYPTLEYTVQYRETDLNFVCRLMEKYGIYYYFQHTQAKHTLVLCDGPASHDDVINDPIVVRHLHFGQRRDEQQFDTWNTARALQTGKDALNDYFYEKPTMDLLAKDDEHGKYTHAQMETYDYPGGYEDKSVGETLSKVRVEAVQAQDDHRVAVGAAPSLYPGVVFNLAENSISADNGSYMVLRCTHSFIDQTFVSGGAGGAAAYAGTYEMMQAARVFRAPLITRRAVVIGWQSALVCADKGNESEEIDVDQMGRVLVKFYWDRKKDLSRRVRVAQFWAGKTRGAWWCPRIGDEVLIAYEDGDPDRPMVVGSVYNGENTVPMPLPSKKTQSGILTKSSKSSDGYHMLMFDDTVNKERIKLRSQRDLMFKALRNEQRDILYDQTENIGKDETINVGMDEANDMQKGGGNWTLNAFKTANIHVGPKEMPMTHLVMTQQDITLSVGPADMPMTQIKMTMQDITLQVGPEGLMSKITLSMSGIQHAVMAALTTQSWTPASVSTMSPMISETAMGMISMTAPTVSAAASLMTPALVAGAAVIGGVPI